MATVQMVQVFKNKWKIISTKNGTILNDHIFVDRLEDAEWYVKNYISSWVGWTYEMKPLVKEKTS